MRKAHFLFMSAFLFLCAADARAQNNGAIVEQTPCPANTVGTYGQYVDGFKGRYVAEAAAAEEEGLHVQLPANLSAGALSKEEFEREKAYAGFECRRIKYLSDGLKVVGYIWKPKNTEGKKIPAGYL